MSGRRPPAVGSCQRASSPQRRARAGVPRPSARSPSPNAHPRQPFPRRHGRGHCTPVKGTQRTASKPGSDLTTKEAQLERLRLNPMPAPHKDGGFVGCTAARCPGEARSNLQAWKRSIHYSLFAGKVAKKVDLGSAMALHVRLEEWNLPDPIVYGTSTVHVGEKERFERPWSTVLWREPRGAAGIWLIYHKGRGRDAPRWSSTQRGENAAKETICSRSG